MLNEFDDIEVKIEDDLNVESKNSNLKNDASAMSVSKLNEEIRLEKESRKLAQNNVENFKKSRKPKKSLKNKILAWGLGIGIFAGAVAGGTALYKDQTTGNGAYKNEIRSRYEKVDETLNSRLSRDVFSSMKNRQINKLSFSEIGDETAELEIRFEGDMSTDAYTERTKVTAVYEILKKYYDSLVDAESSNNMLTYLDCLNEIFETMEIINYMTSEKVGAITNQYMTPVGLEKINNLFALDVEEEGVVKQIGFLPYDIEVVSWEEDTEKHVYNYTYKFSGISYCQTTFESNDSVVDGQDLVVDQEYDKNHVKAYYRDFILSTSHPTLTCKGKARQIADDIVAICRKEKTEYEIKTTYFAETQMFNPLDEFNDMNKGNFNFKKPDNLNLNDYTK